MKHFLTLLILVAIGNCIKAQNSVTISGTVSDDKHLSLPGATVFLTGTKSVTACDNNGRFRLENVAPGSYQLVVKMIGFVPFIQTVNLYVQQVPLNISLKPNVVSLKEVKIRPDYDRLKHLAIFVKEFIGQSNNAKECKILNPDILYFNYDKHTHILTATADEILKIQNNALGYQLNCVLTNFQYNENTNVVTWQGYPSFVEMPGTPKQQALWDKSRKIAYLGSINHFIRSIYNNQVYQEGFSVYKLLNRPMGGVQPEKDAKQMILVEEPIKFDSLVTVVDKNLKSLTYKDCLYVVYKKEQEESNYLDHSFNVKNVPTSQIDHNGQSSLVYLVSESIEIDNKGLFNPTDGLFFEGYWAWEKNADLMPLEYTAKAEDK